MKKAIKNRMIKRPREWYNIAEVARATRKPDSVPMASWTTWSLRQRAHFNRVFDDLWASRKVLFHPKTPAMDDQQFKTVAHNAAWIAAEQLD